MGWGGAVRRYDSQETVRLSFIHRAGTVVFSLKRNQYTILNIEPNTVHSSHEIGLNPSSSYSRIPAPCRARCDRY